jgi:two-component system, chemotaxis family, chemotaxis protein CheY
MKKRVLIVDDSLGIREAMRFSLENEGYEVLVCENGKNALSCFNGQEISLVVTDLYMPQMDGIEFIRNVRQLSDYQKIPMLLLTTETQIEKIKEAKEAGATGWIIKPFVPAKLMETIRKLIK